MLPEFLQKWEQLLEGIDKKKIPLEFIKKLVIKLKGKKQQTINIEKLLKQGLETEEIEESENAKVKDEFSLEEIDFDTLELADEEFDLDLE